MITSLQLMLAIYSAAYIHPVTCLFPYQA